MDPYEKVKKLADQAAQLQRIGKGEKGLQLLSKAVEEINSFPKDKVKFFMGLIRHREGRILQAMKKYPEAVVKIQEAIEFRKDDPIQYAYSMFQLFICKTEGKILITDEEVEETRKALWKMLDITGDLKEAGDAWHNLGFIDAEQGDVLAAIQRSLRALGYRIKAKDERGIALTCARLGEYYKIKGDDREAEKYGRKALEYFEAEGDIERIRQVKENVFGETG